MRNLVAASAIRSADPGTVTQVGNLLGEGHSNIDQKGRGDFYLKGAYYLHDDMNDVTRILNNIEEGQTSPEELLPAVYEELRQMAAGKMTRERPGHTLQATALVHEAWMRLGEPGNQNWENRAHFFGAASEAMRRILVDHARKKNSEKRGGGALAEELSDKMAIELTVPADELLAVDDALDSLAEEDPQAAELVKLRYFVGMTMEDTAEALGMKKRTAEALWTYAKVWLSRAIRDRG